eukprot:267490-Amphidinium_carterae.1
MQSGILRVSVLGCVASTVYISCDRIVWISVKRMIVALLLLSWATILPPEVLRRKKSTEEIVHKGIFPETESPNDQKML